MTQFSFAKTGGKKLGGKRAGGRRGNSGRVKLQPNGYIRKKKSKGKTYYHYCEAVKQPDGTFKEQCEYLGSAKTILAAVRKYTTEKKRGSILAD